MTKKVAEKIARGITDKIECNTVDIDDWANFWGFTREEYEEFLDMAIKALEQEPKTGHWKLVQRGKEIDVCCSKCEAVRIKGYAYNLTIDQLNKEDLKECFECADMRYCPNCGVKMEVEE